MILIVDDDAGIRASLSLMLKRARYEVVAVATPKEAVAFVRSRQPELILMDMNFSLSTSGDEGLTLLRQVKLFSPDVPVILMTAWGSIGLAVKGMKAGAFDFVTKPWNNAALMERIETALMFSAGGGADAPSAAEEAGKTAGGFDRSNIIGRSPALNEVLRVVEKVARTNASVLIMGESGTGKELIAEALHRNSLRAGANFVKVNLGGMSQSLFESEMFGYRKGAFTGAVADRMGRFELADKGTIFLDEIGDLDISSQVKLLRVLQDQTFEPLGDSRMRQVNVRVVCATNADLKQLISDGRFREDLYYRINLITVHLPALRERRDDIPLLAAHFIDKCCEANRLEPKQLSAEAAAYLSGLAFPGNVRQLKNLVERTLLMSAGPTISLDDIKAQAATDVTIAEAPHAGRGTQVLTLEEQERAAIENAMKLYGGNISRMAVALGLSRAALYRRMEKYGIEQQ